MDIIQWNMKENKKGKIEFLNLNTFQKGGNGVNITKTGIFFGADAIKTLGIKGDDSILIAKDGNSFFMAKRPPEIPGGHRVYANKGNRMQIKVKPALYKMVTGQFNLATKPTVDSIGKITIHLYELK